MLILVSLEANIQTQKESYAPNETVVVEMKKKSLVYYSWLAVYKKSDESTWANVIAWNWVRKDKVSLSHLRKKMPVGQYEVRLFNYGSCKTKAKYAFEVAKPIYDVISNGLILYREVEGKGSADELADKLKTEAKNLKKGWGVAHDENMIDTLQKKDDEHKLDEEGKKYFTKAKARGSVRIIGLCNANKAAKATYTATPVSAMMPCRISLFDLDNGKVGISLINATDPKFKPVMDDLKQIIANTVK